MDKLVRLLKARARILHRQAQALDPNTVAEFRQTPELRPLDDASLAAHVQRRHGLAVVARQIGFRSWPEVASFLRGDENSGFGKLLYPDGAAAHWNIWCAGYAQAKSIREENGGYLLAYQRHYFIADRHFVAALGLDPEDPDWERIAHDWARPLDLEARNRLFAKLIQLRLQNLTPVQSVKPEG